MPDQRPIVVTGAAGFIGSHMVHRLLKDGRRVVALIRENTDTKRIDDVLPQLEILRDDLGDLGQLKEKIQKINPIGVFHFAAAVIQSGTGAPEDEIFQTNIVGTTHLIKALMEVDYDFFINTGTLYEYGVHDKPLRESDHCHPTEAYSISKLAATLYCQAVAQSAHKPILTFRIFSTYGPGMPPGRLFYEVVHRAVHNEEIILTQPEASRDFIFIEDIIDLYLEGASKAKTLSGEVFNAGSGKVVTFQEFVDRVLQLTHSKSAAKWGMAKDVSYDSGCMQADMEKTFAAFSWRPTQDLDYGIRKMAEWFKV